MADETPEPNVLTDGSASPPESWLGSVAAALGGTGARAASWIASGTVIDATYRVVRPVGAGGMAVVYLAHDLELDRPLALKLYDIDARELSLSRIYREARAMARLSHPNVLVVHGVGVHDGRVYLAMEYVEGGTLRDWLAQQGRTWPEIVAMYSACGRGLAAAHAVGIVHGDFKPDNVLIGPDGRPRVADFGLARTIDTARDERSMITTATSGSTSRELGFAGTLRYGAPEQHEGHACDDKADQFAFCVALFEALYGVHPFAGDDTTALVDAILGGRMRPVPSAVPAWLHRVLVRGLSRDPTLRFASIDQVVTRLQHDPRRRRIWGAAAAIVGGSSLALAWPDPRPCEHADAAIEAIWTEPVAELVRTAFADSGSPIHVPAALDATGRIDRWADAWRAQRMDACTATLERAAASDEMLDRRMLCLDRQLDRLVAAVEIFEQADREVVATASDAVAALPSPARCGDIDRMLAAVATPEDPELAASVEVDREALARAQTAFELGRYDEAIATAEPIAGDANASAYPPLAAEAKLLVGRSRWRAFDFDMGETALTEAFHVALAAGDDEVATIAARELVCSLGQVAGGNERALWWSRTAASTADRTHARQLEQLELQTCRGMMLHGAGKYAEAEAVFRTAIAATEDADDADLLRARLLDRLASTLLSAGRHEEALRTYEQARDAFIAERGPEYPATLTARANMARALSSLGRNDEALAIQLEILRTFIAVYGPDSGRLPNEYNSVGGTLARLGASGVAIAYRERGVAIARARGDQGRTLAMLLGNLAGDHDSRGELDQAIALGKDAVAMFESVSGVQHPDTARCRINLGSALARAGRLDEASREFEGALAILEKSLGITHPDLALLHLNLASLAQEHEHWTTVTRHLDAAEHIAEVHDDDLLRVGVLSIRAVGFDLRGDPEHARALNTEAAALAHEVDPAAERRLSYAIGAEALELGDAIGAMRAFDRSRELAVADGATTRVGASLLGMARASWAMHHPREALRFALEARAAFSSIGESDGVAEVDAWLATHRR